MTLCETRVYDKEKGEGVKLSGTFTVEVSTETIKTILEDSREQLNLDFGDSLDNLIKRMSASADVHISESPAPCIVHSERIPPEPPTVKAVTPQTFDEALALAPKTDKRPPLGQWVHIGAVASLFDVSTSTVRRWLRKGWMSKPKGFECSVFCLSGGSTTWFKTGHVARWWYEYTETGILPVGRKKSCRI